MKNPLLLRGWSSLDGAGTQECFTAMQFNTLARGLSSGEGMELFPCKKASTFGDFMVDGDAKVIFDWTRRKWLLLDEILRFSPDIIAMEEVDHFPDFFCPALAKEGYDGLFRPKERSPCLDFGFFPDGVALFWSSQKFTKLSDASGTIPNHPGVPYLLVTLRHIATQREMLVAAVHLKAQAIQAHEDIREQSIKHVLAKLEEQQRGNSKAVLLLGDFNTSPVDVEGVLQAKCIPAVLRNEVLNLQSSYPLPNSEADIGRDAYWTTWKTRKDKTKRHLIDYIFHSPLLQCTRVLLPPDTALLGSRGLPSVAYPSDHVALMAGFRFS
eukprot:GGOE01020841.1.p1 GENE.GGOE01020841.1~~GGOE01020841.1.p1  ORF type:complete len:368 (+),score=66.29 GGOE01020841.1:131-1105(+)